MGNVAEAKQPTVANVPAPSSPLPPPVPAGIEEAPGPSTSANQGFGAVENDGKFFFSLSMLH